MTHPVLIVLNGASSAGKTVTAQALLKQMDGGAVLTGFDEILERTKPFGSETGGWLSQRLRPYRLLYFMLTDGRWRLFQRLHREIVSHVQAGRNVIVETALMEKRLLLDAATCFAPIGGYFIGMKPPLSVSEQWEAGRADRPPGQARKHYDLIHAHGVYDLVLDPSTLSPEDCARMILSRVEGGQPTAFKQLIETSKELLSS
jgi:chloramphenicol 3-O phosphotransferase